MIQYYNLKNWLLKAVNLHKDHSKQVKVERVITRRGKTLINTYWVDPDKVESTDKVLLNHHNLPEGHPQRPDDVAKPTSNRKYTPEVKAITDAYFAKFTDREKLYDSLRTQGIEWDSTSDAPIMWLRAKKAVNAAIHNGYKLVDFDANKLALKQDKSADTVKTQEESAQDNSSSKEEIVCTTFDEANTFMCGSPSFRWRSATPDSPYGEWGRQSHKYEREQPYKYTCHSRDLNRWHRGLLSASTVTGWGGRSQLTNFKWQTQHMDSAIDKFEVKENFKVFRIMPAEPDLVTQFLNSPDKKFRDPAYMSTSLLQTVDPDLVKKFPDLKKNIQLEISIPKGKGRGLYVAPLSRYPKQCEFILARGSEFSIDNVEKLDNGCYKVKCTLIGSKKRDVNTLGVISKSEKSEPLVEENKWERFIGRKGELEFLPKEENFKRYR